LAKTEAGVLQSNLADEYKTPYSGGVEMKLN
jgi:hypothetical protein